MKKIVLVYGLIAGIICAVVLGGSSLFNTGSLNYEYGMYIGFASMILAAVVMWFGMARLKKQLGGRISFGKAFKAGLLMTLIASTLYVAAWMVTGPANFGKTYSAYEARSMKQHGATEQEIAKHVESNREFWERYDSDPLFRAGMTYVEIVPVQLVIVLIAAIVLAVTRRPGAPV
ncbi:MAG: DUF4199 domain-containing protein [Flavipsychrobacter sp.]|nr:DUF4199 domain-containing protein [Flavipsychrobacter sp.]